jgi:NodT family efflux transporter outer membrane factor (OMF) lipoprotein
MSNDVKTRGRIRQAVVLICHMALAGIVMVQSGCTTGLGEWFHNGAKVGPNYRQPPAPLPERWLDEGHPHVAIGEPNLASWWEVFDDPALTRLLRAAHRQNLTVRQAGIQILQAQIQRNIARSELLPQAQSLLAQYTHGEVSRNNGVPPGAGATFGTAFSPSTIVTPLPTPSTPIAGATPTNTAGTTTTGTSPLVSGIAAGGGGGVPVGTSRFFDNFGTSLNLAWELDFWGLFRRNLEAADAGLEQSVENNDEILVQLLANVATQYVELRTLQRRLQLARRNVAEQEPLVAALFQRFKEKMKNSEPAYFQLKSNLDNTRALIPPLEISLRQANNQLCILLGIPVRDLLPELGDGIPEGKRDVLIPRPKDDSVVVGIPGDILLRRPDVLAQERQLQIQSAQIGIAEAQMFPHIGINGSIGLAADRLSLLFNQQSWIGSIGPSLTWNILHYGRLLANVRFQNYQYQQYVLAYQQALLNANQDAENALVAYLQSLDQTRHLQDSADAAVRVTMYYYKQLKQGFVGGTDTATFANQIFVAQNFQVTQQDAAAQAEGNIALNLILLYRAMGGGWQIRLEDASGRCRRPEDITQAGRRAHVLPPVQADGATSRAPPYRPPGTGLMGPGPEGDLLPAPRPVPPAGLMPRRKVTLQPPVAEPGSP